MKKIVALMLSLVMVLCLAACGGSSSSEGSTGAAETTSAVSSAETKGAAEEEETTPEVSDDTDAANSAAEEIVFQEMDAIDTEECSIKITNFSETSSGCSLKVELENKSEDVTYMFSVQSASVNGVDSDPYFATTVAAGKKSNNTISFSDSNLTDNGITQFTDIALSFRVYDDDDWMADDVVNETVHVYPYGEENAVKYVRESQPDDTVLVDNDYVTVTVTGYDPDYIWGYGVNLYFVNKTDTEAMFGVDDASINGYMIDPFYSKSVSAGSSAFSTMSWFSSDLDDNGIDPEDIEEIEFELRAYNYDDWMADDYFDETVTLNP